MTFEPPTSGSTRLSKDVWELICNHAAANGNSSPRDALEQLVRLSLGGAKAYEPPQETTAAPIPESNALAAFDALNI